MAHRSSRSNNKRTRQSPPSAKLVRAPAPSEAMPQRVVRVWRRVLERQLRRRLHAHAVVELHDNTHTMITFRRLRGTWHVRLHHMFLAAPDEVLDALAGYLRDSSPDSSTTLDRFIERNKALIRKVPLRIVLSRQRITPVGRVHDLADIYAALNRRYFRNQVNATITFGPAPRTTTSRPRRSIKMGSYSAESRLIRIHPALDHARVPRYFVEWIVFHEMLHHVHRARRGPDGRRCVHTPEFLQAERRFHDLARAQRWEDENLDFLLGRQVRAVQLRAG